MRLCTQIMKFEAKQAYKLFETGDLDRKAKNMKPNQPVFFTLVAICLKVIDKFMCLTGSVNLNAKQYRQYMQERRRKVEATGSARYQNT